MITLTVLHSEWEANLANLNKPDSFFPCFTTIGPEPSYTWVGGKHTAHRSPPSTVEIAALRSFAASQPGLMNGATELNGWQLLKSPWEVSGDYRSVLVQLRGERRVGPFDFWGNGKRISRMQNTELAVEVDYVRDEEASNIYAGSYPSLCWDVSSNLGDLLARLPRSHRKHRSLDLKPYAASPIAALTQAGLIAKLPFTTHKLHGWVITGPPGTSKTTYATAALIDMWTDARHSGYDLFMYRVEVPEWLAETAAWDTRDFEEEWLPPEPEISAGDIERKGGFPVLWLEELDKFKPTENRLNYLYRLVNTVYEMQGLIIVTCNDTEIQLRERLGPSISRRIFGDNDDPKAYMHWPLFAAAAGNGKQKGKAK